MDKIFGMKPETALALAALGYFGYRQLTKPKGTAMPGASAYPQIPMGPPAPLPPDMGPQLPPPGGIPAAAPVSMPAQPPPGYGQTMDGGGDSGGGIPPPTIPIGSGPPPAQTPPTTQQPPPTTGTPGTVTPGTGMPGSVPTQTSPPGSAQDGGIGRLPGGGWGYVPGSGPIGTPTGATSAIPAGTPSMARGPMFNLSSAQLQSQIANQPFWQAAQTAAIATTQAAPGGNVITPTIQDAMSLFSNLGKNVPPPQAPQVTPPAPPQATTPQPRFGTSSAALTAKK